MLTSNLENSQAEFQIFNAEQFIEDVKNFVIKKDVKAIENYFNSKLDMATEKIRSSCSVFDEGLIKRKIEDLDVSNAVPSFKRQIAPVKSNKKIKNK